MVVREDVVSGVAMFVQWSAVNLRGPFSWTWSLSTDGSFRCTRTAGLGYNSEAKGSLGGFNGARTEIVYVPARSLNGET